jgi:transcriptional regulator with XRE-family HTH domain
MKDLTNEEKELISRLGKRIKQLRLEKGFTNYEHFANEHGISRTQYGRYETGDNFKFLTLCKILKGLDISLKDFFKEGFEGL